MTNVELLLGLIAFLLLIILMYVRWIYVAVEYNITDAFKNPVNQYGESFTDAIQNSIARGQRGVSTYD